MDAAATEGRHLTCKPKKKASVQLLRCSNRAPPAGPSLRSGRGGGGDRTSASWPPPARAQHPSAPTCAPTQHPHWVNEPDEDLPSQSRAHRDICKGTKEKNGGEALQDAGDTSLEDGELQEGLRGQQGRVREAPRGQCCQEPAGQEQSGTLGGYRRGWVWVRRPCGSHNQAAL